MYRKNAVNKILSATALSIVVILSCANAFASDRGRGSNSGRYNGHDKDFNRGKKHEVVVVGREKYNYHDGRFFRPGWFGFEFFVSRPPFGAIVMSLPFGHNTVIIGGAQYYHYDNIYYKPYSSGYIVVPQPAVVDNIGETVTINVPNSNGSYTSITLVKRNNGYFGPQGEYYPDHPIVEQLRALYGK